MNDVEQRKAAKEFSEFWQGKGYEKGQSQQFWMSLLSNVFGIENRKNLFLLRIRSNLIIPALSMPAYLRPMF